MGGSVGEERFDYYLSFQWTQRNVITSYTFREHRLGSTASFTL